MDHSRRHLFHGNASAVAARIRRPVDFSMPVQAACSLPVTGGISEATIGPKRFGDRTPSGRQGLGADATTYISFDSASASAHGDYIDQEKAVEATRGQVPFASVPTATTVKAEVTNLLVIGRVSVETASMRLRALGQGPGEPAIDCDAKLEGVAVDGYPVKITLDIDFFCECDTLGKLGAAAAAGRNPDYFFDAGTTASYGFHSHNGMVKATLVKSMEWAGEKHPEATIDGHAIVIPNFGKVYFAEMFVTSGARRLTMVTFHLGSDDGGDATAASGDTNGSRWPPDGP